MQVQKQPRHRNVRLVPLDYGHEQESALSSAEQYRAQSFLPVIDQRLTSFSQRSSAYKIVCSQFDFPRHLDKLSHDEIQTAAATLVIRYKDDIDNDLGNELVQFAELLLMFKEEENKSGVLGREHFLYQLLISKGLQSTFPNVGVVLCIYLILMVANCSGERSF